MSWLMREESKEDLQRAHQEKLKAAKTVVLLVVDGNSISKVDAHNLSFAMLDVGIRAFVLRAHRSDSIPVELFDLSRLPEMSLSAVEKLVEDYSRKQGWIL